MPDPTTVNAQIVNAINQTQLATLAPSTVRTSGAGKAYQSVAQTAAIAVQDATDNLRNLSTMSTTALGVAMSQLLSTGEPSSLVAISVAQGLVKSATEDFRKIGTAAGEILAAFPSG